MIYGEGAYATVLREFISTDHVWIAQQTDVGLDGKPLTDEALDYVHEVVGSLHPGKLVIISTQLPVGSCRTLERAYPWLRFVVQPENVRIAHARDDFLHQYRMVFGSRHDVQELRPLVAPYATKILFMSPESAEMSKHAVNGFLALCVAYGNDLGRLCELWGADSTDVVEAMRTERRIADAAPLVPGDPPSVHLLREVHTLVGLGAGPLIRALL